jgi:hypothetical protein
MVEVVATTKHQIINDAYNINCNKAGASNMDTQVYGRHIYLNNNNDI